MKTWILLIAAAAVFQAAGFAQGASAKEEKEILTALDSYKNAMLKRDAGALEKLFHKDLTYSHSNGKLETKAEAIAAATTGSNKTQIMDFSDTKIRVYGNTALARGDVHIKSDQSDLKLSVLHVFLKTPQGWQLVARQSTRYIAP